MDDLCYTIHRGVIYLAEFCKCGSLVINGRCTNKSCAARTQDKLAPVKATAAKKSHSGEKVPVKSTKTRRSSKCITYNLYETQNEEGSNT